MSVILDDDLRRDIAAALENSSEPAASLLRKAIKVGLPLVKAGSGAEPIALDGELNKDVGAVSERQKWSRQKVLIEAIRIGLPTVATRFAYAHPDNAPPLPEEEIAHLFAYDPEAMPLARDLMGAKLKYRLALQTIAQMCEFPSVDNLHSAIQRLTAKRRKDGKPVGVGSSPLLFPPEEIEEELAAIEPDSPLLKASAKSAKNKSGNKK